MNANEFTAALVCFVVLGLIGLIGLWHNLSGAGVG